jgi:hypothetical protein
MPKWSWSALFLVMALTACHGEHTEAPPAPAPALAPAEAQPDKPTTPPVTEEGVRGVVLGEEFFADQILLEDDKITFSQGKEFFADRAVIISVFPDELAVPGITTTADVKLSHRPDREKLPQDKSVRASKLSLIIGPAESLGAEVEIELETDGPSPTRIVGRGYATFKDLRVWNHAIDLNWDSFDTLRYVAQSHLQGVYRGADIETTDEFGMEIFDPGDDHTFKTGFIGYELTVDGSDKGLLKLQLLKGKEGWRVANVLPANQIHEAHPLDASAGQMVAASKPETVAARAMELKLQKQELMPRVRRTHVECYVGQKEARGSCDALFELVGTFGTHCSGQNYRMEYVAGEWKVAGEIGSDERVDYTTGNLVSHKPSMFGCWGNDFTPLNEIR